MTHPLTQQNHQHVRDHQYILLFFHISYINYNSGVTRSFRPMSKMSKVFIDGPNKVLIRLKEHKN
jgi:hypothetical protein